MRSESKNPFYIEIARISAILLASVLAMMVFMLIVGVQSPATNIKPLLFATLISLGATLVVCVVGNILEERMDSYPPGIKKANTKDLRTRSDKAAKRLVAYRLFQQAVFVISIISTVLLALAIIQFLYKPAPSPAASQQPSGSASGQQAESPEDHAKEGSASPQNQPTPSSTTP